MARRGNDAALKDVSMLLLKEEFVRDIARKVLRLTTHCKKQSLWFLPFRHANQ